MKDESDLKYIVRNRKARHDYEIKDTLEAGIELMGSEVKSIRDGKINLADSYATIENGEVVLKNLHINPYDLARDNHSPTRPRRLLVHRREIRKLQAQTQQKGLTLVPLSIYFRKNIVKVELALAAGRKKFDKREAIAKADAVRQIKRAVKKDL